MEKLIIKWSGQGRGTLSLSFADLGMTKEEWDKLNGTEQDKIVQKELDGIPEEITKSSDSYFVK